MVLITQKCSEHPFYKIRSNAFTRHCMGVKMSSCSSSLSSECPVDDAVAWTLSDQLSQWYNSPFSNLSPAVSQPLSVQTFE